MIVIPMAGASRRFMQKGYEVPKYMLEAHDESLFEWSVKSFEKYFETDFFVFVAMGDGFLENFINNRIKKLGIKNYKVLMLDKLTSGQAETVYKGIIHSGKDFSEQLYVFNIDTVMLNFEKDTELEKYEGYLEVFESEGTSWSFAVPKDDNTDIPYVAETREKVRVSNLCSNGLYYFKTSQIFVDVFKKIEKLPLEELDGNERYVAPMYNYLIAEGKDVCYKKVNKADHIFSGIPSEYEDFKKLTNFPI